MFTRAVLAFLALPGIFAFAVPMAWLWSTAHRHLVHPLGLILLGLGSAGLLWCVRDFYVAGKGTLAPWAPPRRLVVVGLYRYSRNPMYLAVILILAGWASAFASKGLFLYLLCVLAAFHLRVVFGEEPWLARTHGEEWQRYRERVPRWLG
jgi:protein-S-isoprenylcysteine O-methyltransferase Ste14